MPTLCTVVPVHGGEILGPGLLLSILRDTDLTKDDLSSFPSSDRFQL